MNRGVLIALAIGIAAALGFFTHRASQPTAPAAEVVAETGTGAEAADEAAPEAPAIPETLPHFELADRDGKLRSLSEWRGQPVMVNYWATWCAPCRREIPLLNELRDEYSRMKLEVIGIAVDFREDVLAYAKETTISYPLLIGEEDGLEAVTAVGMQPAFPFTVFADSQQRIVAMKVGELHRDDAELILDNLARVDAGTLPLADARTAITEGLKELATRRATSKATEGAAG